MAVLSTQDRASINSDFQGRCSDARNVLSSVNKGDILAAVNAADNWADNNASSYNTAIPQPARNNLTAKQKALILALVILKRWEVTA